MPNEPSPFCSTDGCLLWGKHTNCVTTKMVADALPVTPEMVQHMSDAIKRLTEENDRLRNGRDATAWLIESNHRRTGELQYWCGVRQGVDDYWSTVSLEAVRFSRKEDAERVLHRLSKPVAIEEIGIRARAEEHMWMVPRRSPL